MKKALALLLVVVMVAFNIFALTSCFNKKGAKFELPAEGYDGSEVTINFFHTMGASLREKLDEAIVRFNEIYPNIHIVHEQTGGYDDIRSTISTELSSGLGTTAHIAYCYPDHVALYNTSASVVTLDQFISSTITVTRADGTTEILGLTDAQIADFIPGYYAEGAQFDEAGTMYTLPMSKSSEVLYYNKDFFEDNKLSVPTTWQELGALCAQIKAIDPTCTPLGYDSEANWFITMTEQIGSPYTSLTGEKFIFDNDQNYDFIEMFREWYKNGYFTTQELNGGKYTSELFTATSGTRCYMSIGSTGGSQHQAPDQVAGEDPFTVGIAPIPTWENADGTKQPLKVISQGPSLCIFDYKQNPQEVVASWLFVKFLTTDAEFQAKFSQVSGYAPVIKSVQDLGIYANWLAKAEDGNAYIQALAARQCLAQADSYYTSPAFNGSSMARDEVGKLVQSCFTQTPVGNESVRDMIKRLFAASIQECEYYYPNR